MTALPSNHLTNSKAKESFVSEFGRWESGLTRDPIWLKSVRKNAFDQFSALGMPTTRNEEWKHTSLMSMNAVSFKKAQSETELQAPKELATLSLSQFCEAELVFIDGQFVGQYSSINLGNAPGLQVESLAELRAKNPVLLEPYLGTQAQATLESLKSLGSFSALNTAFLEDGAFLKVARSQIIEKPVHLLYLTTSGPGNMSHPRNLIIAEEGSKLQVIETYAGVGQNEYFTNAFTQVWVGQNASVEHYKIQQENTQAFHVGLLEASQMRDSRFTSHLISLGGRLVRNQIYCNLKAEGSECVLNGLYGVSGKQHVDNFTVVDHLKPHCKSQELYKGILSGSGRAVFTGKVLVRPDAQKTDAEQENMNLLLSDHATINTKPQLEIYADDVKCTHGAAIGRLDENSLFYLRSRGISESEGKQILTHAFAGELLDRITIEPLRARVDAQVHSLVRAAMDNHLNGVE